jgi:hypothetical protein
MRRISPIWTSVKDVGVVGTSQPLSRDHCLCYTAAWFVNLGGCARESPDNERRSLLAAFGTQPPTARRQMPLSRFSAVTIRAQSIPQSILAAYL